MSESDEGEAQPIATGSDRRRFPRIRLSTTVRLQFPSADAAIESSTVDISEGGVFIRMSQPRAEGTSIRLYLQLGKDLLEIGGVVVRSIRPGEGDPPGIGVLFTDIEPEDVEYMQTLVRSSLDDPESTDTTVK